MRDLSNKIEKSLKNLARLVGINVKYGWKTELAKWYGIESNRLSTWIKRNRIPKAHLIKIAEKGYPENHWHLTEDDHHTPEATPDTDLETSAQPESADDLEAYYQKLVSDIMASGQTSIIAAIGAVLEACHSKLGSEDKIKMLETQLRDKEKELAKTRFEVEAEKKTPANPGLTGDGY